MTRVSASETMSKPKASSSTSLPKTRSYPLRGHPTRNTLHITPTKSNPVKSSQVESNLSHTPTPLIPSGGKCSVCQGIEEIRSYNLKEAVQEFSSKLESYVELSKSLGENSSNLKHAIATIKHSILHLDPKVVENHFTSVDNNITTVGDNLADLSNYITKLDTIHQITESTEELIHSNISNKAPDKSMEAIDSRLHKLESICSQLSTKIDTLDLSKLKQFEQGFHDIVSDSATPTSSNTLEAQTVISSTNTHSTRRIPSTNTVLIIGDSNTKYVNLNSPSVRLPTYLIEDIDPVKCIGYHKICLHVGINNLKSRSCRDHNDIIKHFNLFSHKLHLIKQYCPYSKIVISPILPTGIQVLNQRAVTFNRMLFSRANWFHELNFNQFCGEDGMLLKMYRCYGNGRDNIHLGAVGIRVLTGKIKSALSLTDTRSYAYAVRTT